MQERFHVESKSDIKLVYLKSQKDVFNSQNPKPYWEAEKFDNGSVFYRLNFKIFVKGNLFNIKKEKKWPSLTLNNETKDIVVATLTKILGSNTQLFNFSSISCYYGKKDNNAINFDVKIESHETVQADRGTKPKYRVTFDIHVKKSTSGQQIDNVAQAEKIILNCAHTAADHIADFENLYNFINPNQVSAIQNDPPKPREEKIHSSISSQPQEVQDDSPNLLPTISGIKGISLTDDSLVSSPQEMVQIPLDGEKNEKDVSENVTSYQSPISQHTSPVLPQNQEKATPSSIPTIHPPTLS